jgi:hypothetical protein
VGSHATTLAAHELTLVYIAQGPRALKGAFRAARQARKITTLTLGLKIVLYTNTLGAKWYHPFSKTLVFDEVYPEKTNVSEWHEDGKNASRRFKSVWSFKLEAITHTLQHNDYAVFMDADTLVCHEAALRRVYHELEKGAHLVGVPLPTLTRMRTNPEDTHLKELSSGVLGIRRSAVTLRLLKQWAAYHESSSKGQDCAYSEGQEFQAGRYQFPLYCTMKNMSGEVVVAYLDEEYNCKTNNPTWCGMNGRGSWSQDTTISDLGSCHVVHSHALSQTSPAELTTRAEPNFFTADVQRLEPELRKQKPVVFLHVPKCGGHSLKQDGGFLPYLAKQSGRDGGAVFNLTIENRRSWDQMKQSDKHMYTQLIGCYAQQACREGQTCLHFTWLRDPISRFVSEYNYCRTQVRSPPFSDQTCQGRHGVEPMKDMSCVEWDEEKGNVLLESLLPVPPEAWVHGSRGRASPIQVRRRQQGNASVGDLALVKEQLAKQFFALGIMEHYQESMTMVSYAVTNNHTVPQEVRDVHGHERPEKLVSWEDLSPSEQNRVKSAVALDTELYSLALRLFYRQARAFVREFSHFRNRDPHVEGVRELSKNKTLVAFLHVPKTGGTSVNVALRRLAEHHNRNFQVYRPEHMHMGDILLSARDGFISVECVDSEVDQLRDLAKSVPELEIFTFLRNPLRRSASEYAHMVRHGRLPDEGHAGLVSLMDPSSCVSSGALCESLTNPLKCSLRNGSCGLFQNHQTLVLSGHHKPEATLDERLQSAKDFLDSMIFFGIVEYYQQSICLFLHTVTPSDEGNFDACCRSRYPSSCSLIAFENVVSNESNQYTDRDGVMSALLLGNAHDCTLFTHALQVFHARASAMSKDRNIEMELPDALAQGHDACTAANEESWESASLEQPGSEVPLDSEAVEPTKSDENEESESEGPLTKPNVVVKHGAVLTSNRSLKSGGGQIQSSSYLQSKAALVSTDTDLNRGKADARQFQFHLSRIILIGLCVSLVALLCPWPLFSAQHGWLVLQAVRLVFITVLMANITAVLPLSYQMMQAMDRGAASSGALIAIWGLLSPLACLASKAARATLPFGWQVASEVCAMCIASLSGLLFALCADPLAWGLSMSDEQRYIGMVVGRSMLGVSSYSMALVSMQSMAVTPKSRIVTTSFLCSVCITLGIAIGPVVTSIFDRNMQDAGIGIKVAAPVYFFSALFALIAVFVAFCTPRNYDAMLEAKTQRDQVEDAADQAANVDDIAVEKLPEAARTTIWLCALFYGTERALIVAALEAATSLVLGLSSSGPRPPRASLWVALFSDPCR